MNQKWVLFDTIVTYVQYIRINQGDGMVRYHRHVCEEMNQDWLLVPAGDQPFLGLGQAVSRHFKNLQIQSIMN